MCWPEAIQYLLRTYATSGAIHAAIVALSDTRKKSDEHERVYGTRLTTAASRFGNVHSSDDKITLYVDGLNAAIRTLVQQLW